ncbi:hypothetical protein CAPTEDRAFT_162895 [Capitella teleta]|uniref:SOCS box domain-containing protein n=1 Tax=Capitella teleta TaxID=283909 RepID=R7UTU9_CAPTE|nr:hypothetical protein CAPTEDRAFT_162895 [Capitella teleta]|eukprot:ELU09548.1 hypothetical protein CAPTEDRAFT_162895 [Capitella teleta]
MSLLSLAVVNNQEEIVKTLLNKGADMDKANNNDDTPLHLAAQLGLSEIAATLISADCNINLYNGLRQSPLAVAVAAGQTAIVTLLIDAGADLDALDGERRTPLIVAAQLQYLDIVKLLIMGGEDLMFRTQYAQDANLSDAVLAKHAAVFTTVLSTPRGLQLECRGVIRETLGSQLLANVQLLPLPSRLKDFILMHKELCMEPL